MAAMVMFNAIPMVSSATTAQWSLCGEYTLASAARMLTIELTIAHLSLVNMYKRMLFGRTEHQLTKVCNPSSMQGDLYSLSRPKTTQ